MNINRPMARPAPLWLLLSAVILVCSSHVLGQTSPGIPDPSPSPTPSLEKKFFVNILRDQRAIWLSPFRLGRGDSKWLTPLILSTGALVATDRYTSGELVEHGDNRTRLRISKDLSHAGSVYAAGGVAAIFYLTGRAKHNARARETGLLATEALIDSNLVVGGLKMVSQRQRPPIDNSSGEFFDGGHSFPSGHAANAWSVATVIACEYGQNRPLVRFGAYTLATVVSISRFTGRNHFLSDVLIGSAIGYGIGRYVYHQHHDASLDSPEQQQKKKKNKLLRSKLFPRIAPRFDPRFRVYGATVGWDL